MAHILVIYEIRNNEIKKVSFEAGSAALELAGKLDAPVSAVLIGAGTTALAEAAGKYGVNKAIVADSDRLAQFSPDVHAKIIARIAGSHGASHIFMGATSRGKDLMPRVAFELNGALAQDITGFSAEGGTVQYQRPILAGKMLTTMEISAQTQLATVRPNIFKAHENPVDCEVVAAEVDIPEAKCVVVEEMRGDGGKLDVTEAEIIVSGGRGMKGPEHWGLIDNLAAALGAATGASRAVVDAGWRDHAEQVGQTGKTVSPNLYVACGISGAIQHQAGMSSSKYIVAINKDAEAPIFKIADYGVVGDVFEILPAFTEAVQKLNS